MLARVRSLAASRALTVSASTLLLAQSASAAVINYGNFSVPSAGITFTNVTESSGTDPVPLYGPPAPFAVGLDFDPTTYVASATAGASDITSGQLNFGVAGVVVSTGSVAINTVSLFEAGDFTLAGTGTTATQALGGAILRVTVLEVNGVPVIPFSLPPSNASISFNLVANPGVVQPWSLGTSLNLPPNTNATRIEVVIDNDLSALSQAGSIALIAKKDFRIEVLSVIRGDIPEPSSAALAFAAFLTLPRRRRPTFPAT